MADEIRPLEGYGGREYRCLFLYPITTPKVVNAANVIHSPTSSLDPLALSILTQAEQDALNAGTLAYETLTVTKEAGLSAGQLQTRLRAIYASKLAVFEAAYAERYLHLGTKINAV